MMDREGNWTEEELNDGASTDIVITAALADLTRTTTWVNLQDIPENNSTGEELKDLIADAVWLHRIFVCFSVREGDEHRSLRGPVQRHL